MLHAFIAKEVYQFPNREALVDALKARPTLRRLCGWESIDEVPSLSTFCRAFQQFAKDELIQKIHAALIEKHCQPKLVGHVSRDATAIDVRERAAAVGQVPPAEPVVQRKRGRPKKGEAPIVRAPKRLELQPHRSLEENLADLPKVCDSGCKTGSKGQPEYWRGYKLHLDVIDGDIPVSAVLTSASTHDSQVAVPLMQMTAQRVTSLYDLMDAAYDSQVIRDHSLGMGHVPIIEPKQRGDWKPLDEAQRRRFAERSASERVNGRLKDCFGGRTVRVRGAGKVMCHLMFGVLIVAALGIWQRLC
jgi:IS5 family transposase